MKKVLTVVLVLIAAMTFTAQAQTAVKLKSASAQGIRLTLNPADLQVSTIAFAGDTFSRVDMEGFGHGFNVGCPDIPVMSKMIEVPLGATMHVRIISESHKVLSGNEIGLTHRYLPSQPSRRKSDTTTPTLSIDNATYAKNAFYGRELVEVANAGIARDRRLANLLFSPVQYNPVTNEVVIYENVEVAIDFDGADMAATDQMKRTYSCGAFGSGIETLNTLPTPKDYRVSAPIRYTIIAYNGFRNNLDEFIAWKKRKGYMVDVHYTDETEIGTTTTSITNWLQSQYDNATTDNPAPTYVLLVGDVDQIPAYSGRSSLSSAHTNGRVSDLYYFTWTSGDEIPDCYYGRFSAQDVSQLTPQIEKTLYYEQYQFASPAFLGKAMIIAGTDQGYSSDNAYSYADPTMDYVVTNYVNSDHNFTQVKYYKNDYSDAPTANGVTTVSNGGYSAYNSSNSTALAVKNEINEGRGWINYSAHGDIDEWSIPNYTTTQVAAMTNANKFGVMIGNCCLTNSFQSSECFGEALLRKSGNCGAVAYIGASDYTYWAQDFYWGVGYRSSVNNVTYNSSNLGVYDRLFHTHSEANDNWCTTTGSILYAGNMAVQASGSASYAAYYWEVYHLMGDPSVQPWLGQAQNMDITYTATLPFTSGTYNVTAVPYAYVALTQNGERVVSAFADANGNVSFPMSDLGIGIYELTASAQGYQTAFRTVTIVAGDGPYVLGSNFRTSGGLPAGDIAIFNIDLSNVGNDTAHTVDLYLECDTNLVTPIRSHFQATNLTPDWTFEAQDVFRVMVHNGIANGTSCPFTVYAVWDGTGDTSSISTDFSIMAPDFINVTSWAPDYIVAGGSSNLSFTTANDGTINATNITSRLICGNPYITISNADNHVDTLAVYSEFPDHYSITVDAAFTGNHLVPFYHTVTNGIYTHIDTVTVLVTDNSTSGYVRPVETFENGNFNSFNWVQGSTAWQIDNSTHYAGSYSAKAGNSGVSNSSSTLSLTFDARIADTISFYVKVSSESGYDKFNFYLDGEEMSSISGEEDWELESYAVAAGTHTIEFEYAKDYSVNRYDDCVWIDNISLPRDIQNDLYVFDTVCAGEDYVYDGQTYTTSDAAAGTTRNFTITRTDGATYLTIAVGPQVEVSSNMTIERGEVVTLVATNASTYEWSNGETGSYITVMPTETTTYTVTGHSGNCSSTATVTVTVTEPSEGIDDVEAADVVLYPNPATNQVNIESEDIAQVRLMNTLGQTLQTVKASGRTLKLDTSRLTSGIYLIEVRHQSGLTTIHKLVRK